MRMGTKGNKMTKEDFETQLYICLDDLACNVNDEYCSPATHQQETQYCYESAMALIEEYFETETVKETK